MGSCQLSFLLNIYTHALFIIDYNEYDLFAFKVKKENLGRLPSKEYITKKHYFRFNNKHGFIGHDKYENIDNWIVKSKNYEIIYFKDIVSPIDEIYKLLDLEY